jgi:hypothetical protein
MRGSALIENSFLRNVQNINIVTIGAPGSAPYGPHMPPKMTTIRNVKFATVAGNVGGMAQSSIAMSYSLHYGSANLIQSDTVQVFNYNQIPNNNFRVYYLEQAPSFVVPQSNGNLAGSPAAGLTNASNWNLYSIAIGGAVAPCDQTLPGIQGFVCPATSPPGQPPPSAPTNVRLLR